MQKRKELILVIHNVRSALNVGALFRTADGAGVKRIFLTGYTPCPHPLGESALPPAYLTPAQKSLAKTALGAEKIVSWKKSVSPGRVLAELRQAGFAIVALEQHEKSIDYREYASEAGVALVIGNEVRGLDAKILKQCDVILEIPMRGAKNSLNVSVAAGIALYQIGGIMEAGYPIKIKTVCSKK
ncbi:MAG: TrmH family RNA methyltransferase [Candidatus Moraniibacteriota bacterium]